MAIKLAFSTVACPDWPLADVVARAGDMGYEGVELRTLGPGDGQLASDPALTDPGKVAALFERADVSATCLSTSTALHHRNATAAFQASKQLKADLALAAAIGCPAVRIFGERVEPGQTRQAAIQRIAASARPLADAAADLGIQLLFENAGSFNHAKEWWWLLDLLAHPMVGLCWNVANAAAAGEHPTVSVPGLNTLIRLAKVKDTRLGEGTGFVPLGEGDVPVETFLERLLGIGFDGWVSVEWDRLWLPSLEPPETYLPAARERLRAWVDAIDANEEKGRKAAAKAAARAAPKPAAGT